jgi:hypothetical protein
MKKIVAILIMSVCLVLCYNLSFSAEYSSDPNDFNLLKNTAWMFTFSHGGTDYTKIVGFLPETISSNDKGDVSLGATDADLMGVTLYGDKIGESGKAFICTLQDQINKSIFNIYEFNISENIAIGTFIYYDRAKPSAFWESFLLGVKIADKLIADQNQPIQIDPNKAVIPPVVVDPNQVAVNPPIIPPQGDQNQIMGKIKQKGENPHRAF